MKKILVTGGAGFIGSNLCESLLKNNYEVVCLDNFSTGHIENIQFMLDDFPDKFTLIEGDIRSLEICRKAVNGVTAVLHEAALGSVPRSINDPITTNDVNITGFLNMLVAARDERVDRFIFAASSSTYGDDKSLPKIEEKIGKQLSPYAVTKYVNELYADVFARLYGIRYIGIRYFNVFGRRQDPHSPYAAVIPLFIKQLLSHESPKINGDGTISRDFTYIDNIIKINMLALKTQNPKAFNAIYNGAGGESTTLTSLVNSLIADLAKYDETISHITPVYGPERSGDIRHSLASIKKACDLLGYQPCTTFREGLSKTAEWYHNQLTI